MDKLDFVEKLSQYYTEPSQIEIDVLTNYFDDKEINFKSLFNDVVENYTYKSFPKLAVIKKFLVENQGERVHSGEDNIRNMMQFHIDKWFGWTTQKIIDNMKTVDLTNPLDQLFHMKFDELYYEYNIGMDNNWPDSELWRHLHHVKECLKSEDWYCSLKEQIEQKTVKKQCDERSKKTDSFENLKMFGYE